MARRAASTRDIPDDDDSQKENAPGSSPPVSRSNKGKEPIRRHEEQSDRDGSGEEEDAGSPKGRKRARVNEEGDAMPVKAEKTAFKAKPKVLLRDKDQYVMGSIVRVKLHNFVTYDDAEFRPGPHLNMIIGPNGTGKSSIACAIALGLNYPPSILGRSTELNSFVKMGTTDGFIEIELKGKPGKPNVTICRKLSAKSKSSTFTLDSESATGREINAKMAELSIQVDSLCSFLPQDRVSEFAHMTPQALLRETERAAGDDRLTSWHDTLINAGKERKELTELLAGDQKQLDTLQERNATLERDVQRFKERKEIEEAIALLELIIPFMEYMEARQRYTNAKAEQRRLHLEVVQIKERNKPMLDLKKKLENDMKRISQKRDDKKKAAQAKFKTINSKKKDNEDLENRAEDIQNALSNLKRQEKKRLQDIATLEKEIKKLGENLESASQVKLEKADDIQEEIRALNAENNKNRHKFDSLEERQHANVTNTSFAKNEMNQAELALRSLDNVANQKLNQFRQADSVGAEVVVWLRNNQHRFRQPIIEPPMLSATIPNRAAVDAVEACFSFSQLKTFVAQNEDDYQLLNRLVNDTTEALGKKVRIPTWYRPWREGAAGPSPLSEEEMRTTGFDGYAIDFVDCPEGLRPFLMLEVRLHRTAIALNERRVDGNRAMELISREGNANFIVGRVMNQVTRSAYGRRLAQNMTREIGRAKNFVGLTVDPARRVELQEAIAEAATRLEQCEQEAAALADEDREIRRLKAAHAEKHAALLARRQKIVDHTKKISGMKARLTSNEERLKRLQNAPPPDVERNKLKNQLAEITKRRIALARSMTELIKETITYQKEATKYGLEYIQISSNKAALETLIQERDGTLNDTIQEYNRANQEYQLAKEDSKDKLHISKEKLNDSPDSVREAFQKMEEDGTSTNRDVADLSNELEEQRQKLELCFQTNPGVIEQYERRKAEIETLSQKLADRQRKADKIDRQIKVARDNWQPALESLVRSIGKKFSAAFDRIGCAGEVSLTPHDDYDKWAITIMVKFRDHEKLQQLTVHRQSGGERSLTTILYLMSLTEHARAPFALVDEINQGMDQRAERCVHNELVATTCDADDAGQYFLITPKLLPDLMYHKRMKVLCVNNGEWLPEQRELGDLKSMLRTFVNKRGGAGPSAA
ncbi:unnamed protein product [Peniophora sp. CBMAI 1063]|nr:unnamed protein product [Peniophora sp. CBMAI 1063]